MKENRKKNITFIAIGLMAIIGTYNAVMINADSLLSSHESRNFKRLDETLGVVVHGRVPAVTQWSKVGNTVHFDAKPVISTNNAKTAINEETNSSEGTAAIQESLDLKLSEVSNPKKWANATNFNGSITTKDGIIESLSATLPNGKSIEISFIEMTGNTFEYDLDGELYSAMMYQVDQNAYMVTLTNGPLEGTRMRFSGASNSEEQIEQTQQYLAENHNIEVGTLGVEIEASNPANELEVAERKQNELATFNFNQI